MSGLAACGDWLLDMVPDSELLRQYVEEGAQQAFTELVRRHLGLVYFGALRRTGGDHALAADVSQTVFVYLARQAPTLRHHPVLTGWLFVTTRHLAINARRAEARRRHREHESIVMHNPTPSTDWDRLQSVLHENLDTLGQTERDAVLLRFYSNCSFAEIGATLRITEEAARKRVVRALDKLHGALARRGVTSTVAALTTALTAEASQVPPAALAGTIAALAAAPVVSGPTVGFSFVLMKKLTVAMAAVAFLALAGFEVVEVRANRALRAELETLPTRKADLRALDAERAEMHMRLRAAGAGDSLPGELARAQQRVATLKARPPGVVDAAFRPATQWANVGRATPEAANETFHWALFRGDVDAVGMFVAFSDDSPAAREAFMAHFSEAVRARYRTPEAICAAAFFGAGQPNQHSPEDAFQLLAVDDHVGGNGTRFGQKRVLLWYRLGTGEEFEGGSRWQQTPLGWAPGGFALATDWEQAARTLDPATGNRRPKTATEHLPMAK
jgi:RNA polymerase sigma factor (sigma-70 family)